VIRPVIASACCLLSHVRIASTRKPTSCIKVKNQHRREIPRGLKRELRTFSTLLQLWSSKMYKTRPRRFSCPVVAVVRIRCIKLVGQFTQIYRFLPTSVGIRLFYATTIVFSSRVRVIFAYNIIVNVRIIKPSVGTSPKPRRTKRILNNFRTVTRSMLFYRTPYLVFWPGERVQTTV